MQFVLARVNDRYYVLVNSEVLPNLFQPCFESNSMLSCNDYIDKMSQSVDCPTCLAVDDIYFSEGEY